MGDIEKIAKRLTVAQKRTLLDGRQGCIANYQPAVALVRLGLMTSSAQSFGSMTLDLTDAGKLAQGVILRDAGELSPADSLALEALLRATPSPSARTSSGGEG